MIASLVLAALVARCAPNVGPMTMQAIVLHESGGQPFAIGDNTVGRSYFPNDAAAAATLAYRLLRARHNLDLGYAQINSSNFPALGLNVESALDPCSNIAAAAHILRTDYAHAARIFEPGQCALAHAFSRYHTGDDYAGLPYARTLFSTVPTGQTGFVCRGGRTQS